MILNKREKGWVRVIASSSNHLQDQVFNLLNYSILEPDEKILEHKNFHLNIILEQMLNDLELLAQQKNIGFKTSTLHDNIYLNGDPWRLRQIVMKFCGYTINYTDSGDVSVEKHIKKLSNGQTVVTLRVIAKGIAHTSKCMNKVKSWLKEPDIFALDHKDEMMLDLIIISRMLELMKGEFNTIEESDGHLSVEFVFPFTQCDSADLIAPINELQQILDSDKLLKEREKEKKVLVVDDNPLNVQMLSTMLEMMDLKCDVANNGKEAVEKFGDGRQMTFDLILMDCLMPVMNGYDATTSIRNLEKEHGTHTPIIAITAKSNLLEKEECLSYGMDDHLSKPYKMDELQTIIHKYI